MQGAGGRIEYWLGYGDALTDAEPDRPRAAQQGHIACSMASAAHHPSADDAWSRVVVHFDLDCFYAQVEHNRLKIPLAEPLVVVQWNTVIANNYASRKYGIKRGTSAPDARRLSHPHPIHVIEVELIGDANACDKEYEGEYDNDEDGGGGDGGDDDDADGRPRKGESGGDEQRTGEAAAAATAPAAAATSQFSAKVSLAR